jgi:hypothetical protein
MDEDLKAYLDNMMAQITGKLERVLDRVGSLERDFQNTKEFLVGDSLVSGRRWLDSEGRITRLEEELRRMRDSK